MLRIAGTILGLAMLVASQGDGCDAGRPEAASGVGKVTAQVQTGADGMTVEQRNVRERLLMDNKPGSIKHLYIISSISGQVLLYSTVRGKVTSSGKRLTPSTSNYASNGNGGSMGFEVQMPSGGRFYTSEVLQDDGTYGSSTEYLYWWDVQGRYHQIYPGGVFVQLSDQPLPVKSIVLNLETQKAE